MRYLLVVCFSCFLFAGCKEGTGEDVVVKGQTLAPLPVSPEKIKGTYSGEFKGSPLSIVLTYVTDKQAAGYDVHKGINRDLSGVVDFSAGKLHLYLVEPGDSRYDGQFHLSIDTATWKGEGTWKSFVTGTKVSFRFQKRSIRKDGDGQTFVDNQSNYITLQPDGSCTYNFQGDSTSSQSMTIKGHYKKEKNKVTIHWEKNALFPSGKSTFRLVTEKPYKDESYRQQSLKGEGRVFSEMQFD